MNILLEVFGIFNLILIMVVAKDNLKKYYSMDIFNSYHNSISFHIMPTIICSVFSTFYFSKSFSLFYYNDNIRKLFRVSIHLFSIELSYFIVMIMYDIVSLNFPVFPLYWIRNWHLYSSTIVSRNSFLLFFISSLPGCSNHLNIKEGFHPNPQSVYNLLLFKADCSVWGFSLLLIELTVLSVFTLIPEFSN